MAVRGFSDERLTAAEDGAYRGEVVYDFELAATEDGGDFRDPCEAGGGGGFVQVVPFVSGADAEFPVAEGDEPAAAADADVGLRPICREGEDFAFGAAVGAELVFEEAPGPLAEDRAGGWDFRGISGSGIEDAEVQEMVAGSGG